MPRVTMYYFTQYDRTAGETVRAQRPATLDTIVVCAGTLLNRPLAAFMRNTQEDALQLHTQLRGIVTHENEEDWCAFLPAPTPPEGCTEAAQHRQSKHGGTDTRPRSE